MEKGENERTKNVNYHKKKRSKKKCLSVNESSEGEKVIFKAKQTFKEIGKTLFIQVNNKATIIYAH